MTEDVPLGEEASASPPTMRWERWLFVILTASIMGFLWGPAILEMDHRFLGAESVDHYGTQWFYWFVARNLEAGKSFGYTRLLFFPFGKDIFLHTGSNVLDAIVAAPFRWVLGPALGYNVFVLAGWTLGGLAAWRLARRFTDDSMAAGTAALLFVLAPFGLYELDAGRPTQALVGLLPVYVEFLWTLGETRGWRAPVLGGVVLAVIGYQYWYYAIFLGIISAVQAVARLARPPGGAGGRGRILGRHVLTGILAVSLTLPVTGPMIVKLARDVPDIPGLLQADRWTLASTPTVTREGNQVALMVWQPASMTSGHYWENARGVERYMPFQRSVSWLVVAWILLWLVKPGSLERGTWLLMMGTAALIAVGPTLIVGRTSLSNPAYLLLVRLVPPLQRLWWPGRSVAVITTLLVPVTAVVLTRVGAKGRRWLATVAVASLTLTIWELHLDYLAPFQSWDSSIPAGYQCLAEGDRSGAILELPYGWTQAHLYYQTAHGRPIFGGMLEDNPAFTPRGTQALKRDNTFVSALLAAARREPFDLPTRQDKETLGAWGYRYVVLQLDAYWAPPKGPGLLDDARRVLRRDVQDRLMALLGPPVYRDARVVIFAPWSGGAPCDEKTWHKDSMPAPRPPPERHLAGRITDPAFEVQRLSLEDVMDR